MAAEPIVQFAGPRLISHLLAPVSPAVTLPATWNLQLHLGLLKKARQPKWRRCSQWRLTCAVACCKIRGLKGRGALSSPLTQPACCSPCRQRQNPSENATPLDTGRLGAPWCQERISEKYINFPLWDSLVTYFKALLCSTAAVQTGRKKD